jgi:hypothetical protein
MENFKDAIYKETLLSKGISLETLEEATKEGKSICPFCGEAFRPRHASKEEAFKTDDLESREQWLSRCCSDECWDENVVFGGV